MRAAPLARELLCERCKQHGHETPATVVRHREPHQGDAARFFDGRLESACRWHDESLAQSEARHDPRGER